MVNEPQNTFLSISIPSFSLPFESPSMIIQLIPRFRGFPPTFSYSSGSFSAHAQELRCASVQQHGHFRGRFTTMDIILFVRK